MKLTKVESACANTILNCFFSRNEFITHMKLQKLLYFSHGVHLSKYNRHLVESDFEAWAHGPVLPTLYHELKQYRDAYIINGIIFEGISYVYNDGEVLDTIQAVIEKLGHRAAWELSEMTHVKDGPWFQTVTSTGYKTSIPTNSIKTHFIENPVL